MSEAKHLMIGNHVRLTMSLEEHNPDLPLQTIAALAPFIARRDISPVEVVGAYLRRIDDLDRHTNAFITLLRDEAVLEARVAERQIASGDYRGPLHGMPIGLKDLFYKKGVRTTAGSKILEWTEFHPAEDSTVAARLKDAGAIIIGKLNMHEGALGASNDNPHYGKCHNPWKLGHSPGGSSGGSGAAVAAGLCAGALGTDNMGSIRIPAAFCGLAGLKPSNGLVSTRGMMPLSHSTGCIGPLARGVEGVAMMMAVLAGYDPECVDSRPPPTGLDFTLPTEFSLSGMKMGVLEGSNGVEPAIRNAFGQALRVLEGLGAELRPVDIGNLENYRLQCLLIIEAEGAVANGEYLDDPKLPLGADVRPLLEYGRRMPAGKLVKALQTRDALCRRMEGVFGEVAVVLSPTTPVASFPFQRGAPDNLAVYMAPANLCGLPALTLPMGLDGEGMPLGLQMMAPPFLDPLVLRVGKAYQQATDWHERRPAEGGGG